MLLKELMKFIKQNNKSFRREASSLNLTGIPIIVILCYLIGEIYKILFRKKDELFKYIPILLAIIGGIIGIVIYYTNPEIMVCAGNVWVAFGVGVSSGVSATGTNQIIKQLFSSEKKDE